VPRSEKRRWVIELTGPRWGFYTGYNQIDATDAQIDRLVYELYELMPDEIKIVESAAS